MLRGEKVLLRAVQRDDLPRLYTLRQQVDLVLMADGQWQPAPFATFEQNFARRSEADEHTSFVIEADSVIIGSLGLHGLNRREGVAELGIGIYDPAYVGKGYGRDAIRVLLDWAFRTDTWRRIWLNVDAVNTRAIRAYQACGFVEEGRLREHAFQNGIYCDVVVMGILRSEWEARLKLGETL